MPIVMKSSRTLRSAASLLLLGATVATTSCASSDESFNDPVITPQPDARKDTGADTGLGSDSSGGTGSCVASSCQAPEETGMVACCTPAGECGMMPSGGSFCISLLPDAGGGSGGSGGANGAN